MSEYTPTTEQVRRYWQYGANAWADEVARDDDTQVDGSSIGAEFDRWLSQLLAETWDEGYTARASEDRLSPGESNPYRVG